MTALWCDGDACFYDRANIDRSQPLSHVNIRVSGVCPVYTPRRLQWISSTVNEIQLHRGQNRTRPLRGLWKLRQDPAFPVHGHCPFLQCFTIEFWIANNFGVAASCPNALPQVKSRNTATDPRHQFSTRMTKTMTVARTSIPLLGHLEGLENMCLKIDTVVFGDLDPGVEYVSERSLECQWTWFFNETAAP